MKATILFLIALITILAFSCTTLRHIDREDIYYTLDFRKYANEGFLITPEMYRGNYMTMGVVSYETYPEAKYIEIVHPTYTSKSWSPTPVSSSEALDSVYVYCKKLGADALVRFNIESVQKEYSGITNPITITGVKLSGYAIKRED